MQSEIRDIIVIGGGLMGSSAAWHLSNNGKNVLLLEQQPPQYTFGSSYGKTRIARSLGPKNDIFSYFHNRSVKETEKLINILNKYEDPATHRMDQIYTTSPVTYIYYESHHQKIKELLHGQRDPIVYAGSAKEAKQKFGLDVPETVRVFSESKMHSGTLNPMTLIQKLHVGIELSGNDIQYNGKVTRLQENDDLYELEVTDTQTETRSILKSKQVVSAAGPYTGPLLKHIAPVFDELITPKRVALSFVGMNPNTYKSLSKEQQKRITEAYPVIDFTSDITFAMIEEYLHGAPVFKVGGHLVREDIAELDATWKQELDPGEKAIGIQSTCRYLQQLGMPVTSDSLSFVNGYSCVYSLTDSEIPLVTCSLDIEGQVDKNFIVMGGMSGVGAKGAMTYGLIACNLLLQTGEQSEYYQSAVNALDVRRTVNRQVGISEVAKSQTSWFISEH